MPADIETIESWIRPVAVGPYWDVIVAPAPGDPSAQIRLGVPKSVFNRLQATVQATAIAQYYMLVRPQLRMAQRLFRGLNRNLMRGNDMDADRQILIYCWRPEKDFEWVGSRHSTVLPEPKTPPDRRIFVVLVRPHAEPGEPGVYGEVLKWNWVYGDVADGPENPGSRYKESVWTRGT